MVSSKTDDLTGEDLGHSISKKRRQNYALYPIPIDIKEKYPINRQEKVHNVGYSDKFDQWKDLNVGGDSDFPIIKYESLFFNRQRKLCQRE